MAKAARLSPRSRVEFRLEPPATMDLQLKDKVVLVTGGAKGIGAAITKTCAQEGAIAVVADRDLKACEQLHGELEAQGLVSSFRAMDLSSAENCKAIVQETISNFDQLDAPCKQCGRK